MTVSWLTRSLAAFALGTIVLVSLSCGGGGGSPSAPPVVTPTPTATPPPTGGGGGGTSASCTIGPGSSNSDCSKSSAKLWSSVETAMDLTILQKPSVVDKTDSAITGTELYKVIDVNGFIDGTIDNLRKAGLCAQRDPADYLYQRIQVKAENGYSETYDVVSSSGYIRRGNGTYFETCTPSSFPVDLGSEVPPAGSGCGMPYPPPVNRFRVHVYVQNTDTTTLDSTPLVVDPIYCGQIGYTGRVECPIRLEGSPERVPCETWAVGYAQDTGRAGPTWTHHTDENPDGVLCTGKESGCTNHPSNQYQVNVYAPGWYRATGRNGANGSFYVER
jgi:hypothetical protein